MYQKAFKRVMDIMICVAVAPFALLILLPSMLAIAIEDGFPVFYNAMRMGKQFKPFRMYKLRTMKKNAPDIRLADGSAYNSEDDPRLTKVGRFLRRMSIDELPQLLNVFLGQMSIIGPRPDLIDVAGRYTEEEAHRLDILPGITGYSQAYYRNDITYAEKFRYDVYYVRNISFAMDCRILLRTVGQVLGAKGVYTVKEKTDAKELSVHESAKSLVLISCHAPSVYRFRLDMMCALMERGWRVTVCCPETEAEWKERFSAHGIDYHSIKLEKNGTNPLRDLKGLRELRRYLRETQPTAVFCGHAKGVIYGSIAAKQAGVRNIYPMIAGAGSVLRQESGGLKSRFVQWVLKTEYRMGLKRATSVFFQNPDDAKLFVDTGMVDEKKIVFVPGSGVHTERFAAKPMPKEKRFLFVGRLIGDKGLRELLECARTMHRTHPDCAFDVVGYFDPNPTAMKPEDLQPYMDEGAIVFHGYQENVLPYLEACYAFVLPSYHEGTPRAVLEAMATGRPIVTTDVPGCRETVVDGENGFLVPAKDAKALQAACERLYAEEALAERMAQASRRMAVEKFDVRIVNARILKTIDRVREGQEAEG